VLQWGGVVGRLGFQNNMTQRTRIATAIAAVLVLLLAAGLWHVQTRTNTSRTPGVLQTAADWLGLPPPLGSEPVPTLEQGGVVSVDAEGNVSLGPPPSFASGLDLDEEQARYAHQNNGVYFKYTGIKEFRALMSLSADYTWEIVVQLENLNGEFIFQLDGPNPGEYGDNDSDGIVDADGAAIPLRDRGRYLITYSELDSQYSVALQRDEALKEKDQTDATEGGAGDASEIKNPFATTALDAEKNAATKAHGLRDKNGNPIVNSATDPANRAPTARIKQPMVIDKGEEVTLDGSASSDPDGNIAHYRWSNGLTGAVVKQKYDYIGTYSITLTVTDDQGANASTTADIEVRNRKDGFDVNYDDVFLDVYATPQSRPERIPLQLVDHHQWAGTANIAQADATYLFSVERNALKSFGGARFEDRSGSKLIEGGVRLPIPGNAGGYQIRFNDDTLYHYVVATQNADALVPKIVIQEPVFPGETVSIGCELANPKANTSYLYTWALPDGSTPVGAQTSYKFTGDVNQQTVRCTVSGGGKTATVVRNVVVEDRLYKTVAVVLSNNTHTAMSRLDSKRWHLDQLDVPAHVSGMHFEAVAPEGITMLSSSGRSDDNNLILADTWIPFADGKGVYRVTLDEDMGTYGGYSVTTVTDKTDPPTAAFVILPSASVTTKSTVTFDGSDSTYDIKTPSNAIKYTWTIDGQEFGPNDNATLEHIFNQPKSYAIRLTVTDLEGQSNFADKPLSVGEKPNNPPKANAGPDVEIFEGDTAFFDASLSSDPDGDTLSYFWSAPLNTTKPQTSLRSVSPESYAVTLEVRDPGGLSATDSVAVLIKPRNPTFYLVSSSAFDGNVFTATAMNPLGPDRWGVQKTFRSNFNFRFDNNNDGRFVLGDAPPYDGSAQRNGALISIAQSGVYAIELQRLSQLNYQYTYKRVGDAFKSNYPQINLRGDFNDWNDLPMKLVADYTWEVETPLVQKTDPNNDKMGFKFGASDPSDPANAWGKVDLGDNNRDDNFAENKGRNILWPATGRYVITLIEEPSPRYRIKPNEGFESGLKHIYPRMYYAGSNSIYPDGTFRWQGMQRLGNNVWAIQQQFTRREKFKIVANGTNLLPDGDGFRIWGDNWGNPPDNSDIYLDPGTYEIRFDEVTKIISYVKLY
jgi:hypothetical protein